MSYKILKRDGRIADYNIGKIRIAITKAFEACDKHPAESVLDMLAFKITADAENKVKDGLINVEDIQDSAEKILAEAGWFDVSKSYILYRDQRRQLRELSDEIRKFSNNLVEGVLGPVAGATEMHDPYAKLDIMANQSASVASGNIGAAILQESEAVTKLFWANKYTPEIRIASQIDEGIGLMYIHDMGCASAYCAGWSLKKLIQRGISGVANRTTSAPAKHLAVLCNQMVNFLGIMQNEWAGAQAFSSFDTYLAPFVKVDGLNYKQVKQCIQSFVYGVNTPSRWGTQAPFSNITIDWTVPDDMKNLPAIVGGKEQDFTYGDCKKEMDMVNKAFIEIMIEGDAEGRGFQYPIPTYSITREFDWSDTENNRLLFEMAAKYGVPYFSNYINSDMNPSDVRSMCCRLRLDLRELRKQNGGNFGAGENTGSIGVVTMNLPHMAFIARNEDEFFQILEHTMDLAAESLDIKRRVVTAYLERENSAYPYTKAYLDEGFRNHFSTIGLVGMNEACLNAKWLGEDLTCKKSHDWAVKCLNFMRNKLSDYQEQYGCLFNLEATPAESTCYTLARLDKENLPGIITAGEDEPYYTNSSHLPVGKVEDIFDALDMEDELQTKYTSGTVFHAFLGERLPDWKSAMNLVKTIAENYELPYFTLSPTYSVCTEHGYIEGEVAECPKCGKKTEIYSRITGYYRAVSNWNLGKKSEFSDRMEYSRLAKKGENGTVKHNEDAGDKASGETASEAKTVLFTTSTCPNCKMAKAKLAEKGIQYDTVVCDKDMDKAETYHIRSVPVLMHIKNDGTEIDRFTGVSDILGFLNQ